MDLIDRVIDAQMADGSWKDIDLITLVLGKAVKDKIAKDSNLTVVITYLICKWIEKHYPGSEYSLVVKKGLNYVKK
jgi:hypothetical protein